MPAQHGHAPAGPEHPHQFADRAAQADLLLGAEHGDQFVPQMVNFELIGGVNFKKGCYPGQEVVARMDTYGNVRRHLVGLILKDATIPPKGAKLFSGDREVGWVSSATFSPQQNAVLAFGFTLRDFSSTDKALKVEIEGWKYDATVKSLPLYAKR